MGDLFQLTKHSPRTIVGNFVTLTAKLHPRIFGRRDARWASPEIERSIFDPNPRLNILLCCRSDSRRDANGFFSRTSSAKKATIARPRARVCPKFILTQHATRSTRRLLFSFRRRCPPTIVFILVVLFPSTKTLMLDGSSECDLNLYPRTACVPSTRVRSLSRGAKNRLEYGGKVSEFGGERSCG